jgi:hypothetical protein
VADFTPTNWTDRRHVHFRARLFKVTNK